MSLTIADLQLQGLVGFYLTCANPMCLYSTPIRFDSLGLDPSTPYSAIGKMRRLECAACGSTEVSTMPERRDYNASENGNFTSIGRANEPQSAEAQS